MVGLKWCCLPRYSYSDVVTTWQTWWARGPLTGGKVKLSECPGRYVLCVCKVWTQSHDCYVWPIYHCPARKESHPSSPTYKMTRDSRKKWMMQNIFSSLHLPWHWRQYKGTWNDPCRNELLITCIDWHITGSSQSRVNLSAVKDRFAEWYVRFNWIKE